MSVADVYTSLAFLVLCAGPLITLFRSATVWATGLVSISRIYDYLLHDEIRDDRVVPSRVLQDSDAAKPPIQPSRTPFAFELFNVSVTSRTTGPVLKQVNLQIPWGSLAMIWGPINSGKSTLAKLLLGEAELNSGTATAGSRTIAYCSQESWIQNGSILVAVIGPLPFVEARYRAVIRACSLDLDISQLPQADQTQTGTGGCNLSGGQRQRLSLARAAYAEEEIMVVDDIFSSVDPDTAALIFDQLFGPSGMVRDWGCTVVMITNRLELLDFADQIYLFSRDGRVTQQNTNDASGSVNSSETSDDESGTEGGADNQSQAATECERDTEPPEIKEKEIIGGPLDDTSSVDFSIYSFFLRPAGRFAILGWILSAMLGAVGEWAPVLCLRVFYTGNSQNGRDFGVYAGLAALCVVLNVICGAVYYTFVFSTITKGIHQKLLNTTMCATPEYLSETDSGDLLNRFGQDLSLVSRRLSQLINQNLFSFFQVLIQVVLISAGSAYAVPAMIFFLAVLGLIQFFYLRTSRQLRRIELQSSAALFTRFTETSDGMQHIRAFGWEKALLRKLYVDLDRAQKPRYLLYCIQRWLTVAMDSACAIATIVFIAVATKLPNSTSSSAVGLSLLGLIQFGDTAAWFIQNFTELETSLGAVRRIRDFVERTPQEHDTVSSTPLPEIWPSEGKIDFSALTATYKTSNGTEHKAVDDLTATIYGGQKIGLMGRTGSGKSTILSAILRMVNSTGSISIDGLDTREVPLQILRSRITSVTQDGLRLNESLRFNMYPFTGQPPSDDEIIAALESVDIWNHAHLNGGLDANYFKIGFSTGQKQLMFLARGILHQKMTRNKIVTEFCDLIWGDSSVFFAGEATGIWFQWKIPEVQSQCPAHLSNRPTMTGMERDSLGGVDHWTMENAQDSICALLSSDILYNSDCTTHSRGCWGFFVLRPAYAPGDDERVAAAMARLDDCVENGILLLRESDGETLSHEELDGEARARYHNILIEDAAALDGANLAQAQAYFQSFAAPYVVHTEPEIGFFSRTVRFRQFILLDDQVLSNLETVPKRGDVKAFDDLFDNKRHWVKLLDADDDSIYDGSCALNVRDLLDAYETIGRRDRMTRFPKIEPPEGEDELWTFCDLI
ncbi:hypothetical protein PWT90_07170 [Aphanocladium album]|nr:hypothetical protein PWT90_07170 [Aphanocladium album]